MRILLVEDNPGDVELTQEAFAGADFDVELVIAENGIEALDVLYQRGDYESTPRPHIILLDLNLPKMDGRKVLKVIKSDDNLKRIPVAVMTSSDAETDVVRTFNLCANAYLTKIVDLDEFTNLVKSLGGLG